MVERYERPLCKQMNSDAAMDQAKSSGRNNYQFYSGTMKEFEASVLANPSRREPVAS